jgi:hypothetical protein
MLCSALYSLGLVMRSRHQLSIKIGTWFEATAQGWGVGALIVVLALTLVAQLALRAWVSH